MQSNSSTLQQTQEVPENCIRLKLLTAWAQTLFAHPLKEIIPLAPDASARRYYRIIPSDPRSDQTHLNDNSYIIMDAPPNHPTCNCQSFIHIAQIFAQHKINVPIVYAQNIAQGFLLLSDFGQTMYLDIINSTNAPRLYNKAFDQLIKIQSCHDTDPYHLPQFSAEQARTELNWFTDWYLHRYLNYKLSMPQETLLNSTFDLIVEQGHNQPTACIHFDFHSKNLMLQPNDQIGILDFQDAKIGPIAYDLMSLVYDHYIWWTPQQQDNWIRMYLQKLTQQKLIPPTSIEEFKSWVDWLAMQRILRNMGNFARLHIHDNKSVYLKDLPRIYNYVLRICEHYPPLHTFANHFKLWAPQ